MDGNTFNYYLGLLQLQMAVLGFVIAGIVALMQILGNARPHRETRLLVSRRVLISYVGFMSVLLIVIALGCWVSAFVGSAQHALGHRVVRFFGSSATLFILLATSVGGLFVFAYLTYKSRNLLDDRAYMTRYVQATSTAHVRDYLKAIYGTAESDLVRTKLKQRSAAVRKQFERTQDVYDPFQPIREYIKATAFDSYDYGSASGLKFFSRLLDKTIADVAKNPRPDEYYYVAKYMAENGVELFGIFEKTSSEKRKMDIIRLLYSKGELIMEQGDAEGLLTIVHGLESIAKMSNDDDEVIASLLAIHTLTDVYLAHHPRAAWPDIAPIFEEICLSVARISETYYQQKDMPFRTVPLIGHTTGEYQTVIASLIKFFTSYSDLADRYTDIYPVSYFESIEGVIEVLFGRLADIIKSDRQYDGFNRTYGEMINSLCMLYSAFGIDAIEHHKPELLALCMTNVRRILKPAKNLHLNDERKTLTQILIELAAQGISELGDIALKDTRTISDYTHETLAKHSTPADIASAVSLVSVDPSSANKVALDTFLPSLLAIK